ncbi:hypothetical protein [Flavobacterium dankookense]|uniref:hypothetical protein n=1 Tax=Flavobacterium dankookense TaxID=706186 RepID=UPI001FE82AFA|nr:hypothetical protein [Flavobacterium dankookense]
MKKIILTILMNAPILVANGQESNNPLLKNWTGPYGGVPAFNEYKINDLKPAIEVAIQEKLNEINAIATNPKPATFENTIVAMEKAGKKLTQTYAAFGIFSSNMSSPEFEPIEAEITPKFSELNNKIYQNAKLFQRIASIYNAKEKDKLTAE